MLPLHFITRIVAVPKFFAPSILRLHRVASTDDISDSVGVSEIRSPPVPKALSAFKINEGGNINRADILGTVTEMKMLDRLSQPERQWATLFVRTRVPILATSLENGGPTGTGEDTDDTGSDDYRVGFRLRTYHCRVHVFDRRLLPLVNRVRPGDRVFVTGFLSYYKPSIISSPDVAKVRKIGAVVAERMVLLGSPGELVNSVVE